MAPVRHTLSKTKQSFGHHQKWGPVHPAPIGSLGAAAAPTNAAKRHARLTIGRGKRGSPSSSSSSSSRPLWRTSEAPLGPLMTPHLSSLLARSHARNQLICLHNTITAWEAWSALAGCWGNHFLLHSRALAKPALVSLACLATLCIIFSSLSLPTSCISLR